MALKGEPFKKFGGLLKKIAPTVLEAVGGPAGVVAGGLIRKALGVGDDVDVETAIADAALTPDGLEKIKLAEIELKRFESEKGFKFAELDVRDVESARHHGIEMAKLGDRTTKQLAWLIVGSFITLSFTVVAAELLGLGAGESTLVGAIIGYLVSEAKQVTAYYFGSSRGSKEKTDIMASGK